MEKLIINATDGFALHALWMHNQTMPDAKTIVLASATGVRKEFYIKFAQYVCRRGYHVLLFDYRGIGESAPTQLKGFTAYMHEWTTKDMNGVLNFLVREKKVEEIIWIGHSVGAQMIGLLEKREHIKKVIAINSSTGYWGYFTFPYNWTTLGLWKLVGAPLTKLMGFAPMQKLGWGENLPAGVYWEWRKWCLSKNHFQDYLIQQTGSKVFHDCQIPFQYIYTSDDYIANDKTTACLAAFYPNAPTQFLKIDPSAFGFKAIGHTGIFRSKYAEKIWPAMLETFALNGSTL
jgi:predicted alpha/beta hydrolase